MSDEKVITEPAPAGERPSVTDRLAAFVSGASHGDVLELTVDEAREVLEWDLTTLAQLERRHVERVLRYCEGNKSHASRVLGMDRRTLYRKLAAWNRGEEG